MAESTPVIIADPAPLGLAGFGMTTFMLSIFNAGILTGKLEGVVLPIALIYGGAVQLLAGMWEYRRGNTFGSVAFTSYGAFWITFYLYVHSIAGSLPAAEAYKATGLFLLSWTIFTGILTIASFGLNGVIKVLFSVLFLTFLLLTIGTYTSNASIGKVGGYLGIITALVAWYGVLAIVANSTLGREVFPMFAKKE